MPPYRTQGSQGSRKPMALEDQTLREALQIHPRPIALRHRLRLLEALAEAGLRRFQVGSLVRHDRMPQMSHVEALIREYALLPGMELWALVLNQKGLQRALDCGLRHVALSASLSPMHSRHNLGCSVEQGVARCLVMAAEALEQGLTVRMGLQCSFGGPMFNPPEPRQLWELFLPFHYLGVRRLALADTAGRATPQRLTSALERLREGLPGAELGLHLHGGPGQLAANLEAAWDGGADWLDVTLEGRGGCPFLPGPPPANLSTQQAVEFLGRKGLDPGVDLGRLHHSSALLDGILSDIQVVV